VLVEADGMGDRLAGVLGGPRQLESLGAVEGRRGADLGLLVRVYLQRGERSALSGRIQGQNAAYTLESSLRSLLGLGALRGLGGTACSRES
jgi:hypothetical protein